MLPSASNTFLRRSRSAAACLSIDSVMILSGVTSVISTQHNTNNHKNNQNNCHNRKQNSIEARAVGTTMSEAITIVETTTAAAAAISISTTAKSVETTVTTTTIIATVVTAASNNNSKQQQQQEAGVNRQHGTDDCQRAKNRDPRIKCITVMLVRLVCRI